MFKRIIIGFIKLFILKKIKRNFYAYKPYAIDIKRAKMIKIRNYFYLNYEWRFFFQFHNRSKAILSVAMGGEIDIDGFTACAGCRIIVGDNGSLRIGNNSYMNRNSKIDCFDKVTIGNWVFVGENVTIMDCNQHTICREGFRYKAPITIGNHVWIGMNVVILPGVTVGDGSIIAAGSIVCHDVPTNTLVGGNPAKVLRSNVRWD